MILVSTLMRSLKSCKGQRSSDLKLEEKVNQLLHLANSNMKLIDSTFIRIVLIELCRRDIYEDEIIALNEELSHLRHVGGRIIEERCHGYKIENQMLKEALKKNNINVPELEDSDDKLTKSE